jgi:hypothetical protein
MRYTGAAPHTIMRRAERPGSAAAAALRDGELGETSIAAAVCCSDLFGLVKSLSE